LHPVMRREFDFASGGSVCRLGLATRGDSLLRVADVRHAVDCGINYLNWCGHPDALSQAVQELGSQRQSAVVAVQLESPTGREATQELDHALEYLGSDYVDIVTYYYVEGPEEWARIVEAGGAHQAMVRARDAGKVRMMGVTTHQRTLAVEMAQSGFLDMLMIRYNAAHRGAERDVFPITDRLRIPVVTFTTIRWGALLKPTPEDPPAFTPPTAPDWYRFVLMCPSVAVALMAPHDRSELDANLEILRRWEPLSDSQYIALSAHGERVRKHAGRFP
jgi:predicted aldo/keto reductase-like oxidoreductase